MCFCCDAPCLGVDVFLVLPRNPSSDTTHRTMLYHIQGVSVLCICLGACSVQEFRECVLFRSTDRQILFFVGYFSRLLCRRWWGFVATVVVELRVDLELTCCPITVVYLCFDRVCCACGCSQFCCRFSLSCEGRAGLGCVVSAVTFSWPAASIVDELWCLRY